jgi:hypothetical protein
VLYFWHLHPAPEATEVPTLPPELRRDMDRAYRLWVMQEEGPAPPPVDVVAFIAKRRRDGLRLALVARVDALRGSARDNLDAIRRTAPNGWEVTRRDATV